MANFSVIVPIYNTRKMLPQCINSILNQTYKNFELILINDGSTDGSTEICNDFAKKDNRIKLINKKNGGVSAARNDGLNIATGKYIVFVDSDDFIENTMLQKFIKISKEYNPDVIICGININKNGRYRKLSYRNDKLYFGNKFNKIFSTLISTEKLNSSCAKMYKNKIIKKNNLKFDENISIGEDLLFNTNYFLKSNSIYLLKDILYHYMIINNNSLTQKYKDYKYAQMMKVNNELEYLLKDQYEKIFSPSLKKIRIKNILSSILELNHKDCKLNYNQKIEFIEKIKKDQKIIIVYTNILYFIFSLFFYISNSKTIYNFSKLIYVYKKRNM